MAETPDSASHGRRGGKSPAAFRTISEVAAELGLPQHVLRFWESKFTAVKPMKRGGGRRYYRPEDVRLLRRIRDLLYDDGYTIKGVQKLLREGGCKLEAAASSGPAQPAAPMSDPAPDPAHDPAPAADDGGDDGGPGRALRAELESIAGELENIRQLLDGAAA